MRLESQEHSNLHFFPPRDSRSQMLSKMLFLDFGKDIRILGQLLSLRQRSIYRAEDRIEAVSLFTDSFLLGKCY